MRPYSQRMRSGSLKARMLEELWHENIEWGWEDRYVARAGIYLAVKLSLPVPVIGAFFINETPTVQIKRRPFVELLFSWYRGIAENNKTVVAIHIAILFFINVERNHIEDKKEAIHTALDWSIINMINMDMLAIRSKKKGIHFLQRYRQ